MYCSDSDRHWSQDICPPNSQIVQKNFIKVTLIIKECPEEILIKLTIVLKISMSSKPNKLSWNDQSFFSSMFSLLGDLFLFNYHDKTQTSQWCKAVGRE
jgi:hypothetical protein